MATFTQDKKVTKVEIKTALKELLPFSVQKIGENLFDAVITVAFAGLTLAYVGMTQPIIANLVGGHIIIIFVLILLRRVVQDFDDVFTVEELSDRLIATEERIEAMYRMMRAETNMSDDELDARLSKS